MNDSSNFQHDQADSLGILLVNLGTPDSPGKQDVRRYLKEFLWDPRVVEVPRLIWWFALNGLLLNTRPRKTARAYAKIWTEAGSPLLLISQQQQQALQETLSKTLPASARVRVELAMRYGSPSISAALNRLRSAGMRRLLVLPLYPQYSATTTASIFDAIAEEFRDWRWIPECRFINQYHDHPGYISALANSVRRFQAEHGKTDKLLMSFHGIPQEYVDKGDPYYCECLKSGRLLAEALKLGDDQWEISFQSRLGPKQWLQPYTSETLERLGQSGTKSVQVICPGFSVDCLETLEEIAIENRDVFLAAGGENYQYIPCLNDDDDHIQMMSNLIAKHLQGWDLDQADTGTRADRAKAYGAKF